MSQLAGIQADRESKGQETQDVDLAGLADGAASRSVDRRTLLLGAAGGLAAAGLPWPARAEGFATSVAARSALRFDPVLAHRLQRVLRDALRDPSTHFPGAILHVQSPRLGSWTGAAGLGRLSPATHMRPGDRFRAGSVIKPFVSVVVLQLAERGRLSLDARLPRCCPRAWSAASQPRPRSRFGCCSATAAGSRNGTRPTSTSTSRVIPRRCGR
jgi:hypothetical protein